MNRPSATGASILLILGLGLTTLAACGSSESSSSDSPAIAGEAAPKAPGEQAAAPDAVTDGGAVSGPTVITNRAIITTVSTTVEVSDVLGATSKVIAAATAAGGYVAGQYTSGTSDSQPSSTLTLRIPSKSLEQFVTSLGDLGSVKSSERSAADVTAEVADIDARLANAKAGVDRLRALMSKATKISDVIEIESALSARQAEAESLAAQQRSMADQTSLATVNVTLMSTPASPPTGFIGGLQSGWSAFTASISGMARVAGWLLPFALLVALIVALIVLIVRKTTHPRPASAPQTFAGPPTAGPPAEQSNPVNPA